MGGAEVRVDELVELASKWATACKLTGNEDCTSERLARGVLDLLGEAQPCHIDEPEISQHLKYGDGDRGVYIPDDWRGRVSPEDAEHMARMLLRAAAKARADAASAARKGE